MSYNATVLKVMIASPGDVANERRQAREVVHEWNVVHSESRHQVLMPIAWETHATPAMGERAQEIINRQLLRDSDILVAVFWTRVGTPTGQAAGGTIEEVEEHLGTGKPAMIYFSSAPVRPDSVDEEQYRALRQFRESCRQRGLVEEYESVAEFREKFSRHLAQTVIQHFPPGAQPEPVGGESTVPVRSGEPSLTDQERAHIGNLSDEARRLVREAALDANGTVLMVETFGGVSVETNGQDFVDRGNARSEARWRSVIRELTQNGFLEQRDRDGQVFSITDEGYRAADLLTRGAA
jgi:hypothetical protein